MTSLLVSSFWSRFRSITIWIRSLKCSLRSYIC
jgi:hypothetical protein